MQLTEIIDKLRDLDKELFLEAYNKWCLFFYDKIYELNDNNIKNFIESITNKKIIILENDVTIGKKFILIKVTNENRWVTNSWFDKQLTDVLKLCQ